MALTEKRCASQDVATSFNRSAAVKSLDTFRCVLGKAGRSGEVPGQEFRREEGQSSVLSNALHSTEPGCGRRWVRSERMRSAVRAACRCCCLASLPLLFAAADGLLAGEANDINARANVDVGGEAQQENPRLRRPGVDMPVRHRPRFLRGDANLDGRLTMADALAISHYLYRGGSLSCEDAGDTDDNGRIDASDFSRILRFLFRQDVLLPPATPYPQPGSDDTEDSLRCESTGTITGERAGAPFCDESNAGGNSTELILFRYREVYVHAGQSEIRVPIVGSSRDGIEGLTVSLRSEPPLLNLEEIDFFSQTVFQNVSMPRSTSFAFDGLSGSGYLSGTLVLDLFGGGAEAVRSTQPIAHLVFSVPEDLEVGTEIDVHFESVPGGIGDLPPIPNELVREGRHVPTTRYCGMRVVIVPEEETFLRGDADRSGSVDISDILEILGHLFRAGELGAVDLPCPDAADTNDDGTISLADSTYLLNYLFAGGEMRLPFRFASTDFVRDDDDLGCVGY